MIDFTKPVQTRDGHKVRILCTDAPGKQPVVGIVHGEVDINRWCINGKFYDDKSGDSGLDLVNVPTPIDTDAWVNYYRNDLMTCHASKDLADRAAASSRLACAPIHIKCNEGDGL